MTTPPDPNQPAKRGINPIQIGVIAVTVVAALFAVVVMISSNLTGANDADASMDASVHPPLPSVPDTVVPTVPPEPPTTTVPEKEYDKCLFNDTCYYDPDPAPPTMETSPLDGINIWDDSCGAYNPLGEIEFVDAEDIDLSNPRPDLCRDPLLVAHVLSSFGDDDIFGFSHWADMTMDEVTQEAAEMVVDLDVWGASVELLMAALGEDPISSSNAEEAWSDPWSIDLDKVEWEGVSSLEANRYPIDEFSIPNITNPLFGDQGAVSFDQFGVDMTYCERFTGNASFDPYTQPFTVTDIYIEVYESSLGGAQFFVWMEVVDPDGMPYSRSVADMGVIPYQSGKWSDVRYATIGSCDFNGDAIAV